jgi:hypothetical protein
MPSQEKEFITRRLQIIDEKLGHPNKYDVDDSGGFHHRIEVSPQVEYALIREARILEKLSLEVDDGKVQKALISWRKLLGEEFRKHKEYYNDMQEAHNAWLQYPWPIRVEMPEPPIPPDCEVTDRQGHTWVVDDELLDVFENITKRLEKWMSVDD